ncbi:MAG: LamG domain-containing protein, partial [Acidobacteriota bacterium]
MDEGSGTVTEDVTGRSADGLLEGATWVTDDPERGTVLDLGAGSDDAHVHVPHFVTDLALTDHSICAWLKPAGSQAGGFLFKGSTTDGWVAGEKQVYFGDGGLGASPGLRPTFVGWGNGWYVASSDVAADTWSHACWIWDHVGGAAGTPRVYLNGTDVGLAIDIHDANVVDRPGDTVRIGHDGSDGVDGDFAGLVDDVAIFDIALSPSQVEAVLRGDYTEFGEEPAPPPTAAPENLRGHWPFDEGSGTVTEDVTGRSADGLLEGATWVTDDPERGTVLDLGAGSDDAHVHVPHFVAGLSRGDYSICAWLKPAGSQAGGFLFKGSTTDPWVAGEKQVYFGDGSLSAASG